jgi:broad specificity phosphatase PhoE
MQTQHIYLTHPQVSIDPTKPITEWSLNELGARRVADLARSKALIGIKTVVSSAETKAVETATPLAESLGCDLVIRPAMHENDRSATGFLEPDEFEATADKFFAQPTTNVRGWETAEHAQARIVREVTACLAAYPLGPVLFVGHGAVGTLLFCHLSDQPISRIHDQLSGGGCWFGFQTISSAPHGAWRPLETLLEER